MEHHHRDPAPPRAQEFGLTPDRLQTFERKSQGFRPLTLLTAWGLVALLLFTDPGHEVLRFLRVDSLLGLVLPLSFAFIIGAVVGGSLNELLVGVQERMKERDPDYDRYINYSAAVKEHERLIAESRQRQHDEKREVDRLAWLEEKKWKEIDGWTFERKLAELLERCGWSASVTRGSGDEGVDIVLAAAQRRVIVQCKAHAKLVNPGSVRELYGTFVHKGADEAWLVSTSGFSRGTFAFAKGKPIRLLTIGEILRNPSCVSPSTQQGQQAGLVDNGERLRKWQERMLKKR